MNTSFYTLLLSLLLVISIGGCSRMEVPSTKFTFFVPQQKTLSSKSTQSTTGFLKHVVINVRGAGISTPISINYDADSRDGSTPQELPNLFTVEIPSGSSRLIQVLAIYSEMNTKNSAFFYGDATVNLNGGEVAVDIPMNLRGSGSTRSGRIAGRYYSSDGSTPTGAIESRLSPAADKPPMIISKSSMTSGWFSAFALEDVPLDIVLSPGEEKIFSGIQLDSISFANNKAMKVTVPAFYQSFGGGTGGENREGTSAVIGFFGPSIPAVNKVCYTTANYTYTNLYQDSTTTTQLVWDASSTNTSNARAVKHATVSLCSESDTSLAFNSVYPFNPTLFNNWGGTEALSGFYGVFKFPLNSPQGSAPVAVTFDYSGQFTSQFSLLPGMPSLFDSIGIYYRSQNSPRDYENGDEAPCGAIALGGFGFRLIATIPVVAGTLDYSAAKPSPSDISMNSAFAYCPLKNGIAVGGGFVNSHPWNLSSGGGGGGGGGGGMGPSVEANSFQAHMMGQVGINQCHRLNISLVNESNGSFSYNVTNSTTRNFTVNNPMGLSFFANESSCLSGSPTITSFSIQTNSNYGEIWVQSGTSSKTGSILIESASSFGTPISRSINLNIVIPSSPTRIHSMRDKIFLNSNGCETIELTAYDYNSTPSPFGGSTTITLNKYDLNQSVVDDSFNFYSSCSSSTPISDVVFNSGDFKTTFAVKANGTPSMNRKIFIEQYGSTSIYMNVTPQGEYASIQLNNGQPIYAGTCVPAIIEAKNMTDNLITTANFPVDVMSYNPTSPGYYGQFRSSCGAPYASNGPFNLYNGTYTLNYLAENATTGLKFETRSVFLNQVRQTNLDILPVPQFLRTDSAKVHLTSDMVSPNLTSIGMWTIPQPGGVTLIAPSILTEIASGANPKSEGALFTTASSLLSGPITVLANYNMAITIRFKITSQAAATLLSLRSTTTTVGDNQDFKIFTEIVNGDLILKGTGGWEYATPISLNSWYTVTLTRQGSNVAGYVNGASAGGTSTFTPSQGYYDMFEVGTGFVGAVKAVLIDANSTGATGIGASDHSYLLQRVP